MWSGRIKNRSLTFGKAFFPHRVLFVSTSFSPLRSGLAINSLRGSAWRSSKGMGENMFGKWRRCTRIQIALSVESPERKWIARVQAGVLIVNQIDRQGPACIPDRTLIRLKNVLRMIFSGRLTEGHLRFRSFFYGTMLSKNGITLPKTPPALCRVFVPAVARLRMLRMSPGAVLNIAPFITALLGVVR
jgi:hypothetical protein